MSESIKCRLKKSLYGNSHTYKKSLILHLKHLSQSFQLQTTSCTYINIHNCHVLNQWQLLLDKAKYTHSIVLSGLVQKNNTFKKSCMVNMKILMMKSKTFSYIYISLSTWTEYLICTYWMTDIWIHTLHCYWLLLIPLLQSSANPQWGFQESHTIQNLHKTEQNWICNKCLKEHCLIRVWECALFN